MTRLPLALVAVLARVLAAMAKDGGALQHVGHDGHLRDLRDRRDSWMRVVDDLGEEQRSGP